MRRLLVISNGIGEDSVGAELVRRLPKDIIADAYPTLGEGSHYKGVCAVVGPRARLASQGSRIDRGTIARDVAGGLLGTIGPALKFLRGARSGYDDVLVIGDFVGIAACWLGGVRRIVWLDVYHTGHSRGYYRLEKAIVRRTCRTVFCRSRGLADSLKALGVDARAAGNVMMDTIPTGEYPADQRRLRLQAVTLLPGSRDDTAANFALQIEAVTQLPPELRPDVFVAVAEGITPEALGQAAGMFVHPAARRRRRPRPAERTGTAHQSRPRCPGRSRRGLGRGAVAGRHGDGAGPRPRPAGHHLRARDRPPEALRGGEPALRRVAEIVPAEAGAICAALRRLLLDKGERERRAAAGEERIGGPGVIDEIVACLRGDPARVSAAAPPPP